MNLTNRTPGRVACRRFYSSMEDGGRTRRHIVEDQRENIGVIACRKRQRCLTLATKLPELEIFQVNIERLHAGDKEAWQAFAIASAENKKFKKTRLGLEEQIHKAGTPSLCV
jgi:hypothetical protein